MSDAGISAHLSNGSAVLARERLDLVSGKKLWHEANHICITANTSSAFVQTDHLGSVCEYARMTLQEAVRAYLADVVDRTGRDLTGIAREVGVSPSTLTRFVNGKVKHVTSLRTLSRVAAVTGVPLPAAIAEGSAAEGPALKKRDKLGELENEQLRLLNRSWDALYDDERAALVATAKAFIANRPGKSA